MAKQQFCDFALGLFFRCESYRPTSLVAPSGHEAFAYGLGEDRKCRAAYSLGVIHRGIGLGLSHDKQSNVADIGISTADYGSHFSIAARSTQPQRKRVSVKPLNNNFSVRFSSRGRETIPVALRRKYGIKGGSRVAFAVTPNGFLLKPAVAKKR
jgi:hypothetical protein